MRPTGFKARLRDLWHKNLLGVVPYVFVTPRGFRIPCRKRYEISMFTKVFAGEFYDLRSLPPIHTVLDIGANVGVFSFLCADHFGEQLKQIVAVEPFRRNAERIRKTAAANGLTGGVRVVNAAISSAPGTAELRLGDAHYSNSLLSTKVQKPRAVERVEVKTLDQVVAETRLDGPDLLKIDVEGVELEVLKGGPKTLARAQVLMVETHKPYCTFGQMCDALARFGLKPLKPVADPDAAGDIVFVRASA